jgi:hypothetical protein
VTDIDASGYVIEQTEYPAGPDHVIVVYQPPDLGSEVDPANLMGWIAADARERAGSGLRLLSMTSMPLRHGGTAFGDQGSGYQTKVAVAVVYERWPGVPG